MKSHIFTLLFLSIYFSGCSNFSMKKYPSRNPNSIGENCLELIHSIFSIDQSDNSFKVRAKRTNEIREAMKRGEMGTVVKLLKESHDNAKEGMTPGALLKGRSYKLDKKLGKLRNRNKSLYVPAFYQTMEDQNIDTFSTVIHVTDDTIELAATEQEAIGDVMKWVDHYNGYWDRMDHDIRQAMEADFTAKHLRSKYLEGPTAYKDADFASGPIPINIYVLGPDGEFISEEISMRSLDRLKGFIKEKERLSKLAFAENKVDDYFRKSHIYDTMMDQAITYRRLELVFERLSEISKTKLDPKQIELRNTLKEVLKNPLLRPRSDAVATLQKNEIKAERRAMWRIWKSKRVAGDAKYEIPETILKDVQAVSPYGLMTKYMGVTAAMTVGTGVILNFMLPLEEWPQYQYFMATVNNYYNDFLLSFVGTTKPLLDCAKSERSWNLLDQSTMNNFLKAHLSRYRIRTRFDSDYDYNQDPLVQKREQELRVLCLKERNNYRLGEGHFTNKQEMKVAYREAIDSLFVDLVEKGNANGKQLAPLINDLFEINALSKDEQKMNEVLVEINAIDPQITTDLKVYMQKADAAAKTLEEVGSIPKYRNLNQFIEVMDKRYNEKGRPE